MRDRKIQALRPFRRGRGGVGDDLGLQLTRKRLRTRFDEKRNDSNGKGGRQSGRGKKKRHSPKDRCDCFHAKLGARTTPILLKWMIFLPF